MPIYEYYCRDCHTIYSFFSRRVNTEKIPSCPKCGRTELARQVSMFSFSRGREQVEGEEQMFEDMDEAKLEKAMASLAKEMEGIDEDDPRQAARVMRRLFDQTGMRLGDSMEEALQRMEAGEDPDRIEEELGGALDGEDAFGVKHRPSLAEFKRRYLPPRVDETLYDL